ncbi:gll4319 [Gloeobacter violaceus PCC 7421]|uniref:Gll4319 protein n=2 Tax=Gloeobacter violaceus TaxID=33072 RepID=Q7NDB6_GLOVI|nr:gll4319 [Gloeobacter violaceus PCC 7421]
MGGSQALAPTIHASLDICNNLPIKYRYANCCISPVVGRSGGVMDKSTLRVLIALERRWLSLKAALLGTTALALLNTDWSQWLPAAEPARALLSAVLGMAALALVTIESK